MIYFTVLPVSRSEKFQASVEVYLRSSIFWDVTLRRPPESGVPQTFEFVSGIGTPCIKSISTSQNTTGLLDLDIFIRTIEEGTIF
jgi:hypothetical protein